MDPLPNSTHQYAVIMAIRDDHVSDLRFNDGGSVMELAERLKRCGTLRFIQ